MSGNTRLFTNIFNLGPPASSAKSNFQLPLHLFCWPLVQELIQLELGVKAFDAISQALLLLHAYLILAFVDIPAMALIMHMKGQNGISPCQICNIKGVHFGSHTNYVPLRRHKIPGAAPC